MQTPQARFKSLLLPRSKNVLLSCKKKLSKKNKTTHITEKHLPVLKAEQFVRSSERHVPKHKESFFNEAEELEVVGRALRDSILLQNVPLQASPSTHIDYQSPTLGHCGFLGWHATIVNTLCIQWKHTNAQNLCPQNQN